jgi:thiamine-monophosphate kinase
MKTLDSRETQVIQRVTAASRLATSAARVILGIGDDAALLAPKPGYQTILTCDWFLEGTHFLRASHPADSVGWKCLARAVSDIAAMGGKPRCFLLSLAIPKKLTEGWLMEFLRGLRRAATRFSCPLTGGDTTRRDEILINITAVGEIRTGRSVRRTGARPGDAIFVSGRLGEADLGLQRLRHGKRSTRRNTATLKKHLYPEPRLALGQWLANHRLASAMMDLSDGLSSDLPRLCFASKVGARIEAAKIPSVRSSQTNRREFDPMALALDGGDDYELLFTIRPRNVRDIPSSFKGIPLTRIGQVTAGHALTLLWPDGREQALVARGWDPFRKI